MDKKSVSRRNMLATSITALAGIALSSSVLAAGVTGRAVSKFGRPWSRDLSKPANVTLRIESLDPRVAVNSNFDLMTNVPLDEVISVRQSTRIPSSYYFDVEVDRRNTTRSDWNYTINLYNGEGNDVGSITTGDGGTAIFEAQQIMFHISTDFS